MLDIGDGGVRVERDYIQAAVLDFLGLEQETPLILHGLGHDELLTVAEGAGECIGHEEAIEIIPDVTTVYTLGGYRDRVNKYNSVTRSGLQTDDGLCLRLAELLQVAVLAGEVADEGGIGCAVLFEFLECEFQGAHTRSMDAVADLVLVTVVSP